MKRFFAIGTVVLLALVGIAGFAKHCKHKHKRKHRKLSKVEKMVRDIKGMERLVVTLYSDVCSNPEASVIASCLAIKEMGKKSDLDSAKLLKEVLKKVKKQSLRNFIQFLIVDSYKDKKNVKKMSAGLMDLIEENLGKIKEIQSKSSKVKKKVSFNFNKNTAKINIRNKVNKVKIEKKEIKNIDIKIKDNKDSKKKK